ncbi:MAG: hypothetical protein ACYCX4_02620 [Bacillota bacterium]
MPKIPKGVKLKLIESMSYDELEQKIRNAIDPPNDEGMRSYRYWIRETFPGYCVVEADGESALYKVEYTVDAEENVTIGQWQEAEYVLQVKQGGKTGPPHMIAPVSESAEEGAINSLVRLTEAAQVLGSGKFRMTVLKTGWNVRRDGSLGDKYYTKQYITSMLPLIEGARAYTDHQTEREERERPQNSVLKLVGHWSDAQQEPDGRATAVFNLSESALWLRPLLVEAEKLNNEKGIVLVGPSINGYGTVRMGEAEGRRGKIVESAKLLNSIDIVTEPGAGGTVDKLLEDAKPNKEDDPVDWTKVTLEELKANRPDLVQTAGQERLTEVKADFQKDLDTLKESVSAVDTENKRLRSELATERIKITVKTKIVDSLRESKLPEVSQKRLAGMLELRDFTKEGVVDETVLKEAVDAAVAEERAYLTKLTESGRVIGMGPGGEPPNPADRVNTVQGKLDKMFGVQDKPAS